MLWVAIFGFIMILAVMTIVIQLIGWLMCTVILTSVIGSFVWTWKMSLALAVIITLLKIVFIGRNK